MTDMVQSPVTVMIMTQTIFYKVRDVVCLLWKKDVTRKKEKGGPTNQMSQKFKVSTSTSNPHLRSLAQTRPISFLF